MQQNNQGNKTYLEYEIDPIRLFKSLFERKLLIFGLTTFITLLSFILIKSLSPSYTATTLLIEPHQASILNVRKLYGLSGETESSVFSKFITNLSSQSLQSRVFVDNGSLNVYKLENEMVKNDNNYSLQLTDSITIAAIPASGKDAFYSVSITGINPELISNYLNELIIAANHKTVDDLVSLSKKVIDIRLDAISLELQRQLDKTKQNRLNEIIVIKETDKEKLRNLNDAIINEKWIIKKNRLDEIASLNESAELARSLGVLTNNFNQIVETQPNVSIKIDFETSVPDWYIYGEKALVQKIKILESRLSDEPFSLKLNFLNQQLKINQKNNLVRKLEERLDDSPFNDQILQLKLERTALESKRVNINGINSMRVNKASISYNGPDKKRLLLLAFIGSFILSILLALMVVSSNLIKRTPA